jgi:aminopeptidase N/puromycin-sensitive aminopeptidase
MQAGEPYVAVASKCEGGSTTLTLSQKRYFNTPEAFSSPNDQLWQIPICLKGIGGGSGKSECVQLTERQQDFKLKGCSKFVFPNAGALGYYRYDYDPSAFQALGPAGEQALTPEERISLIGDEWALMRIGQHSVGNYLALGKQLQNTPGYVLLENFADHLEFVNNELLSPADRPAFQAWLRQSFSPLLQQLGYETRPGDTPEQKQKRAILFFALGNIGDDSQVIAKSNQLLQQYIKDPASVDGTLARAAVTVAARHGDAALYGQYRAQLQRQLPPEQYYRFFYSLGDFPDPALAQKTLDWTLTPEVRGQDIYLLDGLVANPQTRDLAWEFVRQHYDEISKKTGAGLGGIYVFLSIAESFCDAQKRDEVIQFFQQHPMPGTERNQKEAIESINSCIALRGQQQEKLSAWLKQTGKPDAAASVGGNASTVK